MKKLSKSDQSRKNELVALLREKGDVLDKAVEKFNGIQEEAWKPVALALEQYNEAVEEVQGFHEEIVGQQADYINERSESWQSGDRGEVYLFWKDEWENLSIDTNQINPPDPIDDLDFSLADDLEALSDEPS